MRAHISGSTLPSRRLMPAFALAVMAAVGAAGATEAMPPLVVTIGVVGALSGPRAVVGQDHANGAVLAVEDLNARHWRIGGREVVWKLDAEDDQGDPKQAAAVAQKLVDQKVNAVVGHDTSGGTYAAMNIYARAGIPEVVAAATDTRLVRAGIGTFFRVIGDDDAVSSGLAWYAAERLHAKRVAVIDDRTGYGQGFATAFFEAAVARGMEVIAHEYTTDKGTDFSALLTRLRGMQPDAMLFAGVFGQAGPMLRQMHTLGLQGPLLLGDGACVRSLPALAGRSVSLAICGDSALPLDRMPGGPAWKARYDARFGAAAFQAFSPYAYDAVMLVAQAMVKADSIDPARYVPVLREIHVDGVTRKDFHFLQNGNLSDSTVTISRFVGENKVPLEIRDAP